MIPREAREERNKMMEEKVLWNTTKRDGLTEEREALLSYSNSKHLEA